MADEGEERIGRVVGLAVRARGRGFRVVADEVTEKRSARRRCRCDRVRSLECKRDAAREDGAEASVDERVSGRRRDARGAGRRGTGCLQGGSDLGRGSADRGDRGGRLPCHRRIYHVERGVGPGLLGGRQGGHDLSDLRDGVNVLVVVKEPAKDVFRKACDGAHGGVKALHALGTEGARDLVSDAWGDAHTG